MEGTDSSQPVRDPDEVEPCWRGAPAAAVQGGCGGLRGGWEDFGASRGDAAMPAVLQEAQCPLFAWCWALPANKAGDC